MMTPAKLIETYIRAKDTNRPHLMGSAFAPDVTLEIVVRSDAISFPGRTVGLDGVTDVLVRKFCHTYENVYTFCLGPPPSPNEVSFSCAWLVGMSAKEGGGVRIGRGRYDWSFRTEREATVVQALTITIDTMSVLPAEAGPAVMGWLQGLAYPWCPPEAISRTAPSIAGFG